MLANESEYSVVGYENHSKEVFELLREKSQDLRFVNFLEDCQPLYLLVLAYDAVKGKTNF